MNNFASSTGITFTPDQQAELARWLVLKEEAGYTLSELIDEFTDRTADSIPE